jgi:hypothetical protein
VKVNRRAAAPFGVTVQMSLLPDSGQQWRNPRTNAMRPFDPGSEASVGAALARNADTPMTTARSFGRDIL